MEKIRTIKMPEDFVETIRTVKMPADFILRMEVYRLEQMSIGVNEVTMLHSNVLEMGEGLEIMRAVYVADTFLSSRSVWSVGQKMTWCLGSNIMTAPAVTGGTTKFRVESK